MKFIDCFMYFDEDMILIEKNNAKKPVSAVYFDGNKQAYYVKRFLVENTMSRFSFISDNENSQLEVVSTDWRPQVEIVFVKEKIETHVSHRLCSSSFGHYRMEWLEDFDETNLIIECDIAQARYDNSTTLLPTPYRDLSLQAPPASSLQLACF